MPAPLTTRLRELVWSAGHTVALDADPCRRALTELEDLLPAQRDALVAVVQHGLTREVWGTTVSDDLRARLTAELEHAGVDPGLARWALRTWTEALGGEFDSGSAAPTARPPTDSEGAAAGDESERTPDLAGWNRPATAGEPAPPEHHDPEGPAPFVALAEPGARPRPFGRFLPIALLGGGVVIAGILGVAAFTIGGDDDDRPPEEANAAAVDDPNDEAAAGTVALAICDGVSEADAAVCRADQAGGALVETVLGEPNRRPAGSYARHGR